MEDVKEMTADKVVAKEKKEVKKIMVICARGTLEDVYAALIMANGALAEGKEAKMFFTFFWIGCNHEKESGSPPYSNSREPSFYERITYHDWRITWF